MSTNFKGLPNKAMISDRDRTFTRSVWHELVKLSDTTPKSSYHSGLAGWRDGRALARGPAFPLPLPAAAGGAHAKRRDGCAARAGKDGRWRARRDWAGCCVSSVGAARMDMHGWGSFQAWHLVSSRLAAFCRSCQQAVPHATVTGRQAPTATRTDREKRRSLRCHDMHWRMCGTWHRTNPKHPVDLPPLPGACGPPSLSLSLSAPCLVAP